MLGSVCPFCGDTHEDRGAIGAPGLWLDALPLRACPRIPENHIYVDQEYEHGPRGALYRIACRP